MMGNAEVPAQSPDWLGKTPKCISISQFWTFNSQAESAFFLGREWSSSDICMLSRASEMDVSIPKAKHRDNHHTNEDRKSTKGLSYFNDIDLWCFPR